MVKTMPVLPAELVEKFRSGLSGYRANIDKARAANDLDRRLLDIFEGILTGASADPTLAQPLAALKTIVLDGSSIPDALARLANFDKPDLPPADPAEVDPLETPTWAKDLIKSFHVLSSEVYELTGQVANLSQFVQERYGYEPLSPPPKGEGEKLGKQGKSQRREQPEPTQLAFDIQAGQDFVSVATPVSYEGSVGPSNHRQNEDVVGIPISERDHINDLETAMAALAARHKRPLLLKEIRAELIEAGASFKKMSGTWINTTLAQNYLRWGEPQRANGAWWPVNLHLGEVNSSHLYQQVTLPLNAAEAKEAVVVTDAYNALRTAKGLLPLKVHFRVRGAKAD